MKTNVLRRLVQTAALAATLGLGVGVAQAALYGTAGCGLGSVIFHDAKGIVQIFAATTNGTFGTQTFGITSGTSNCIDLGSGTASAKAFIETNRETLAKDIARGGGETITSLATVAGCSNTQAVGPTLQREFKNIFTHAQVSDTQVSAAMVRTLKSHQELRCGRLG